MKNSPICLFVFNRLNELTHTIDALKSNILAKETVLFIFSDGPRNTEENNKVEDVRNYLKTISGFKEIYIRENKTNNGLAKSIINGVTEVLKFYNSAIIIEDDLVSSPNFLNFMNQALNFYKNDTRILSISGYSFSLKSVPSNVDYYFGLRSSSWGWATWANRWFEIDWEIQDANNIITNKEFNRRFRRGGGDLLKMFKDYQNGKIDSWAIRFCFHQAKNNLITVFPSISKIKNIGFSLDATHTFNSKRFHSKLDSGLKVNFDFDFFREIDIDIEIEFRKNFNIFKRVFYAILLKLKI